MSEPPTTSNNNKKPNNRKPNSNKKSKGVRAKPEPDPHKAVTLPPSEQPEEHHDPNAELCLVCADDIQYVAHYPCNHHVCHKCAMRLRALMQKKTCALCRTESETIIITGEHGKSYSDYKLQDLQFKDDKLGIMYDIKETRDRVQGLLKFNCPVKDCNEILLNWKDLKNHVKKQHDRHLCEICCRNKKVFTTELEVFTYQQLNKHERQGDKVGFPGHPECQFCRLRFYSDDELFQHMREKHEKCFICDRQHPSRPQYYKNYDSLEAHFREKHHACLVPACLEQKFVVFGTKLELQDHMLKEHPSLVGNQKAARRIEATFTSSRTGGSGFQGNLSTVSSEPIVPPTSSSSATSGHQGEQFPALGSSRVTASSSSSNQQPASVTRFHNDLPPVDNSRETMERRIEERVKIWVNSNQLKVNRFKDANKQFSNNKLTASALIDEYQRLMDLEPNQMDLLVHETSQLYKSSPKQKQLKQAFKEWQDRQAYPVLGSSTATTTTTTTASSSSSSSSAPHWVNERSVSSVSTNVNDRNAFPSLPAKAAKAKPVSASVTGINKKMGAISTAPKPKSPNLSTNDFPSLPALKKKPIPPLNQPSGAPRSAWGSSNDDQQQEIVEDPVLDRNNFKKKGKKKQVIYRVGM